MKSKYNLYIQKDLQDKFDIEPNMSGLVNKLLAEHYRLVHQKQEDFAAAGIKSKAEHSVKDKTIVSKVIPDKEDVKKVTVKTESLLGRFSNGLCKIHGTPLDPNGKCLQKGCKYAK